MKAYRTLFDLPFQRLVKGLAGRVLIPFSPKLARQILDDPFGGNPGHLGRLIRNGYYLRAVAKRDFATPFSRPPVRPNGCFRGLRPKANS